MNSSPRPYLNVARLQSIHRGIISTNDLVEEITSRGDRAESRAHATGTQQ